MFEHQSPLTCDVQSQPIGLNGKTTATVAAEHTTRLETLNRYMLIPWEANASDDVVVNIASARNMLLSATRCFHQANQVKLTLSWLSAFPQRNLTKKHEAMRSKKKLSIQIRDFSHVWWLIFWEIVCKKALEWLTRATPFVHLWRSNANVVYAHKWLHSIKPPLTLRLA